MGHAIAGSEWRWPNGVIPYTINEEDFPPGDPERAAIRDAVNAWNTSTNISLRPLQPGDTSHIEFVAGDDSTACNSPVGRQHGPFGLPKRQDVHCNLSAGTLKHEIGHAVGLYHEHQRDDRHWHVTVLAENAIAGKRYNFDKVGDAGDDIGAYDYTSVMHYTAKGFAVNWLNGATIPLQRSSARPALAAFDNKLHMVHLGVSPSNDLWHATWTPNGGWTDDVKIQGQKSWATPSLATFNNELHMVHLGSSGSDELWHASFPPGGGLGRDWTDDVKIQGQKSWATPSLAAFNNELHMVHLGSSGSDELWHASFPPGGRLGRDWTDDVKIQNQNSLTAPALCEFGGVLHLAYFGALEHAGAFITAVTMWHATFDGTWSTKDRKDNNRPPMGVALASFAGSVHAAFIGDNGRMWHSIRNDSIQTIVPPAGVIALGGTALSPGDIATVATMYP